MIRFNCPHCGKGIAVKDELAERKGKCPSCANMLQVPACPPREPSTESESKTEIAPSSTPVGRAPIPDPQVAEPTEPMLPPALPPYQLAPTPALIQPHVVRESHQNAPVFATTPTTAIQVNVQQPSHAAHSLGISSLVLGIFSFFVCWLPFIGFPLSGLGFLLGVVGLILALARKGTGIGYSIAGTAVNGIGLLLGFIFVTFIASTFQAVDQAMNELKKENIPVQAKPVNPTTPDVHPSEDDASVPTKIRDQPATVPPGPTPPTEPTWAKAGTPLQLGDVQLQITEVAIGKVPLWRQIVNEDAESEDDLLTIWIAVTNTSERKKIDYQGWMSDYASLLDIDAKLTDDVDNNYRGITFSATLKVKDAVTNESIYPGKSIRDAIVFELPIEGVEYLRLNLSAKGCKEEGEFRFEIPKEMIKRQSPDKAADADVVRADMSSVVNSEIDGVLKTFRDTVSEKIDQVQAKEAEIGDLAKDLGESEKVIEIRRLQKQLNQSGVSDLTKWADELSNLIDRAFDAAEAESKVSFPDLRKESHERFTREVEKELNRFRDEADGKLLEERRVGGLVAWKTVGEKTGEERSDNGLEMKFCWCPPGKFKIGSPKTESGRWVTEDQTDVILTRGFWMGKYEVTQGQYELVAGKTSGRRFGEDSALPMGTVSWEDATQYCEQLTQMERAAERLPEGWEYRLPTEAQWEYACRAGTTTAYSFGDDPNQLGDYAWYADNSDRKTHPVGQKKSNGWGLCDMHGNVQEWCRDLVLDAPLGGKDPEVTKDSRRFVEYDSRRVTRGGEFALDSSYSRSASRQDQTLSFRSPMLGFRVALVQSGG